MSLWCLYLMIHILVMYIFYLQPCVEAAASISRCSDIKSDWDYCVDEVPAKRSWYQAMAECRGYGGQLVSLESSEKINSIKDRLTTNKTNLSSGVYVNAHRSFYSSSNKFAWSSGIEMPLASSRNMEDCVTYSAAGLTRVSCETFKTFFLLCQQLSHKLNRTGTNEKFTVSYSKTKINYPNESCDYLSFVKFNFNWYQARILCESLNSELLGIPNKNECQLIEAIGQPDVYNEFKNRIPIVFLNMHLYMYARNASHSFFRDPTGDLINESVCGWNNNLKSYKDEEYCVSFEDDKTLSPFKCKYKDETELIGFFCKQCLPNKVFNQNEFVRNIREEFNCAHSGVDTNNSRIYLELVFVCVAVIVILTAVALFLALRHLKSIKKNYRSDCTSKKSASARLFQDESLSVMETAIL